MVGDTGAMPRIKAPSVEAHHELVWQAVTDALGELLTERDYESINLGHIAARAGLARNTLYNYASDKTSLVLAIAERASRPVLADVTTIADAPAPAPDRARQIISELLRAFTSNTFRLILRPASAAAAPLGVIDVRDGPFRAIPDAMEKIIRDGIRSGEFRAVDDVPLTAWLLSGIMRAAADQMARDDLHPDDLIDPVQDLIVGALVQPASSPPRPV
jgi:AcrR family transcriptional regulator